MIQAPVTRVSDILERNSHLATLLDNEWIYLMVMDPKQENEIFKYKKGLQWESISNNKESAAVRKMEPSSLVSTELAI
jgi:uncharacterized protein YbcC (UPF0753/DUF2309 family)